MNNKTIKHLTQTALQGLFWLLPIVIIIVVVLWLYSKIDKLVDWSLHLVGFEPQSHQFLWFVLVLVVFFLILYLLGYFVSTRLAGYFDRLLEKIPGYKTVKDMVGIFNSSKKGENQVLVVAIRGFATEGYNIGLMYSQKESIIKDHYTVTLSMSPIPNGGYMFEVHKDNIYIIEDATFDDNLQYLLSMGVKSIADIVDMSPRSIEEFTPLTQWLDENSAPKQNNTIQ